jgi:RNA polymerase sigma-70 factor (ECF subfamily)
MSDSRRRPDLSAVDDRALLARHVAGDPDAFGELVHRHRDRLWAVALRTLRDPNEAADALQDALVSAFRRADSFRGDSAVTTWLHRIVVNACLDRARRQAVRRTDPLPEDDGPVPTTPRDGVEAAAEQTARQDAVLAALRSLPIEQRAALVLVDMEGHSVDEAAQILDCAPGTVKSRCSRGRARLLPLLGAWAPRSVPDDRGQPPEPPGATVRPIPTDRPG